MYSTVQSVAKLNTFRGAPTTHGVRPHPQTTLPTLRSVAKLNTFSSVSHFWEAVPNLDQGGEDLLVRIRTERRDE